MSEAVTVNGVGLFWPAALVAGSTNSMFLIDNDTGNAQWTREFGRTTGASTPDCATVAAAARPAPLVPPEPPVPRAGGGGRGGVGYRGAVGEPGEGVPAELSQRGGGRGAAPPAAAPGARGAAGGPPATPPAPRGRGAGAAPAARGALPGPPRGGGGGLGRLPGPAYAIADDGTLHTMGWLSGKDVQKPVPVLPANARWSDPIVIDNVLYTSTSGGCGGAPDAVWAVDVSDAMNKPVTSWRPNGGRPLGAVAFATDGTVIVAVGPGQAAAGAYANAVVALEPKTLKLKDWFTAGGAEIASAPLVFEHNGKNIVAVAAKDGRVLLLDSASLGGANHSTPLAASPPIPSGFAGQRAGDLAGMPGGIRWLLAPSAKDAGWPSRLSATRERQPSRRPGLRENWRRP